MYIGIDIRRKFVNYSVISPKGLMLEKSFFVTSHTLEELLVELKRMISTYKKKYRLSGIGIAVPTFVKENGVTTAGGSINYLEDINLKTLLQSEVNLPIAIEYRGNCLTIAEKWLGNSKKVINYMCLVCEEELVIGLVIEGTLYRGDLSEFFNDSDFSISDNDSFYQWLALKVRDLSERFKLELVLVSSKKDQYDVVLTKIKYALVQMRVEQETTSESLDLLIERLKPVKLEKDAEMIGAVYLVKNKISQGR